jgi:hypothetical protein
MCQLGQELKMSLEEVGKMSKAEVFIWLAHFKLTAEEAKRHGTNR